MCFKQGFIQITAIYGVHTRFWPTLSMCCIGCAWLCARFASLNISMCCIGCVWLCAKFASLNLNMCCIECAWLCAWFASLNMSMCCTECGWPCTLFARLIYLARSRVGQAVAGKLKRGRVGQNRIYSLCMTACLVIPLPKYGSSQHHKQSMLQMC